MDRDPAFVMVCARTPVALIPKKQREVRVTGIGRWEPLGGCHQSQSGSLEIID